MGASLEWKLSANPSEADIVAGLVYMWSRILVLPSVVADDDIFELGARSLDVMTAVNHLRDTIIPDLSPLLFFEHPRISEQARRLAEYEGEQLF